MSSIFTIEDRTEYSEAKDELVHFLAKGLVEAICQHVEREIVEYDVYEPHAGDPRDMLEPFIKDLLGSFVSTADYQTQRAEDNLSRMASKWKDTSTQPKQKGGHYDDPAESLLIYMKRWDAISALWQSVGDQMSHKYQTRFQEMPWSRRPKEKVSSSSASEALVADFINNR